MFDKYDTMGAYHWLECDPRSPNYNPPLVARYAMIANRVDGKRVLDLGAGDGYLTSLVAPRSNAVVALEYEPTGVELARKMLSGFKNVEVMKGDAYSVPFGPREFDTIMMADVIEHLDDPERAVREMARVMKADGVAYVSTPQWRPDRIWDHRHVKEFQPEELRDLLLKGFAEVELRYAWPEPWSNFYRNRFGWRILKWAGRCGFNPFLRESSEAEGFCQMLAICRCPRALTG